MEVTSTANSIYHLRTNLLCDTISRSQRTFFRYRIFERRKKETSENFNKIVWTEKIVRKKTQQNEDSLLTFGRTIFLRTVLNVYIPIAKFAIKCRLFNSKVAERKTK